MEKNPLSTETLMNTFIFVIIKIFGGTMIIYESQNFLLTFLNIVNIYLFFSYSRIKY